ncbi:hypothetical protein [Riemerella columbina]|uniref:hypothetical protein n=1 Tax=Riemerella columbina TaxID=103810 RepID=UPI00039D12C1|nr:hypothetical protein [Riemerella columbina]
MALCRRLKASGNHSNIALCSKPKAISHLSLKTHHFYPAVGDTLNAIMLNLFTHSVLLYIYGFVNFQFQHLTEWALHLPILKTLKQVQGDTVISAVGFKPKAASHLSLNPFHFYLAESLKLEAYCLYAALSLAFLAMGCSPVLIFFMLCVIYLGAGRFFCINVPMYQCTSIHYTIIQQPLKTI